MKVLLAAIFAVLLVSVHGQAACSGDNIIASAGKLKGTTDNNVILAALGDIMTEVANCGDWVVNHSGTKANARAFNGLSLAGGILSGIGGALTSAGGGGGGK